jgi:hypothetical protein
VTLYFISEKGEADHLNYPATRAIATFFYTPIGPAGLLKNRWSTARHPYSPL